MNRRKFQLDRRNGKLFGVCAGIANHFGWDATWIRVGLVLATLLGGFPWTLIAYGVAAFMARPDRSPTDAAVRAPRTSTYRLRESMRDLDRRVAEVETFVTSPNSRLAHEIESLR